MHPPPIYPQLSHLHDYGLAILAWITPFRNMRPPPIFTPNQSIPFHLKRSFWRSDFLLKYHQNPQVLKRWSIEKKKKMEKRGRKRKAPRVSSNKGEVNILRGEKHFNFKNPIQCDHIFLLHHTISKALFKIIEKNFLTLFGPSFSLAIYMTWVVPFLFIHELYIFSI